jgi:MSHA biogenesis protein MshK
MAGRLIGRVILAGLLLTMLSAQAQLDPMRPPPGMAEVSRPADSAPPSEAGSAVQSVILRKGMKPLALIGGETVTIGSRVGDGKVVSISETEVVLRGPGGRQVLKLNPEVDKTVRQPASAKTAASAATSAAAKSARPDSGKKQP